MITITPFSKPLFLLNEEIRLQATGDRKTISTGSPASLDLTIISLAVNDYFTLTIDGQVLRFDAVASPDDSGLQLTYGNDIAPILNDLNNNYTLSHNYTIANNAGILHFVAKFPGSRFTITTDFTHCPNASAANNVAGEDPVVNDNYGIIYSLEELDPATSEYKELTSFSASGSESISVLIDLFLRKIKWAHQLPSFGQNTAETRTDLIRTFRCKISERYGVVPVPKRLYASDDFQVFYCQLPGVLAPDFELYEWFRYSKKFLSDQPPIRRTWYNAPQFLTFFNPLAGTNNFKVKIVTMGADYQSTITDLYNLSLNQNEIIQFPCSPLILDLPEDTVQYRLYVECETAPYTGLFLINFTTFDIIPQSEYGRAFVYLNTYGAWETLLSWATMKTDIKATRVQLIDDATKSSVVDSKLETYEVSTGRLTHAEAVALRDALTSEQFFLCGSADFIPVVLEPGSFTILDEFEDLTVCKFSYTYSDQRLRDNQYNPDTLYFEKVGFTSDFKIN